MFYLHNCPENRVKLLRDNGVPEAFQTVHAVFYAFRNARNAYRLYDNKAAFGLESIDGIDGLARSLAESGFNLSFDRGDYRG